MARIDPNQQILPSVFDRLLDEFPDEGRDRQKSRGQPLAELRNAIRRDLEALLNTRQRHLSWPPGLEELNRSLINFGIPDVTRINVATQQDRVNFCHELEMAIRRHEPRFQKLKVVMLDNAEPMDRTLRFRVEALVYADPTPEAMIFDSSLDPVTQNFSVNKSNG
jgi:type VI secretion system protein ImpF